LFLPAYHRWQADLPPWQVLARADGRLNALYKYPRISCRTARSLVTMQTNIGLALGCGRRLRYGTGSVTPVDESFED
jgi:hypothetical protein